MCFWLILFVLLDWISLEAAVGLYTLFTIL